MAWRGRVPASFAATPSGRAGRVRGVDQQGFGGDAFGEDDLVAVKQKLEVIDEPARLHPDAVAVDEVARAHEDFGAARADPVGALIDEQPVIGRDQQVVLIVQGVGGDQDRGEVAHRAHRVLADPANGLRAVIAGEHAVADAQILDRALFTGGQRDPRAAGEGDAGDLCKARQGGFAVDADQQVIGSGLERGQWQAVDLGDVAVGIDLDQHQQLGHVAGAGHEGEAGIEHHGRPGPPQRRILGDGEMPVIGGMEREPGRGRAGGEFIAVFGHQLIREAEPVAHVGAVRHPQHGRRVDGQGMGRAVAVGAHFGPFRGGGAGQAKP